MLHETVLLQVPGAEGPTELVTYVPGNFPELGLDRRRPGLIICPGGGYAFRSDREGEPVALRFAGLGYAAFLLNYHVAPQGRWPIPQRQLLAAIDHVRTNCDAYHVDPGAVVVMGFSAGGHLAGCAGTMWNKPEIYRPLKKKSAAFRPDGMVLGYPVVSSGEFAHRASFVNLLGDRYEELLETASLEKQVKKQSPPAFFWHTADDTSVPGGEYFPAGEGPSGQENPGGDPYLPPWKPRPVPGRPDGLLPGDHVDAVRALRQLGGALRQLAPAEFRIEETPP